MPETHSRLKINPHLAECPDFASEDFTFIREAIESANHLSPEDTVTQLTENWTLRNAKERDIWNAQVQADRDIAHAAQLAADEAAEEAQLEAEKEKDTERKEKDKKRPKLGNFDEKLTVDKEAIPILHPYAQKQLTDFKYCPLWYFTKMAATEASGLATSLAPETVNLLQDTASGSLSFQASSTVKPSKNALPDKELSWSQFSYAFSWFLRAIETANWPAKTVHMFAMMFLNITIHVFRQRSNGDKTLLVYADETRRQWHRDVEEGNVAPNLGQIVNDRLENISNDLHDKARVSPVKVHVLHP
ncbi:uncharacterized protein ARMOST_17708 [Armillaria ostoyae]|uniref:Uncharacterized protein n=1 Tax=Armillaria ostoyae TaxID=47428 RepID=A0A284RZQ8_ARMOS|nr:uncharacterized protein ARMOST_17708 [Armillaria ostoyae]